MRRRSQRVEQYSIERAAFGFLTIYNNIVCYIILYYIMYKRESELSSIKLKQKLQ